MTNEATLLGWQGAGNTLERQINIAPAPDFVLTQRAAKGDMEAFEEIYKLHQWRVYGLCLRMTQNPAEAEDITQDVFIVLLNVSST